MRRCKLRRLKHLFRFIAPAGMGAAMQGDIARRGQQWQAARALGVLRAAVMVAFFGAIVLGVFLPIYTDEIGWRFQERAGFDGIDRMFNDTCGANSLAQPPPFMLPARYYSAVFNAVFAGPFFIRLSGILYAIAWGVLLLTVLRRIAPDRERRLALGAIGLGVLALANTPLLLVLSRPEQPVILCTIGALLVAMPRRRLGVEVAPTPSPGGGWARSLAIAALAAVALSYHLKALFLLPVFLVCVLYASRGRPTIAPRVVAALAIVVMTGWAAFYWVHRLQCPDDPVLRAEYARNSAGAILTQLRGFADVPALARRLIGNVSVFQYVALARPERWPLSFWLPDGQITAKATLAWGKALKIAWGTACCLALAALVAALWQSWRRRRIELPLAAALALIVAVLGWSATQLIRNFYEAGFVLPLLALIVALALAAPSRALGWRLMIGLAGAGMTIAAVISVVITISIWSPALLRSWGQAGYVSDQPYSLAIRNYRTIRPDILAAARICRLPAPERAHGLVIDELTYFPYMRSHLPQHWLGVFGGWKGTVSDPIAYLRSRRSDGVLVACEHLPPDLRARARRSGSICCLAPPGW